MSLDWKIPHIFSRNSNIYTFTKNSLFRRNEVTHIYMPWDDCIEDELMYLLKAKINSSGSAIIPYMDFEQAPLSIDSDLTSRIGEQLITSFGETHLVMSNLNSIHVFRITGIFNHDKIDKTKALSCFMRQKYTHWIEVDDLFVLTANHIGNEDELYKQLEDFITDDQVQNFFKPIKSSNNSIMAPRLKWVEGDRNLTYEYFIRSCELQDNIFQESWGALSRSTQHLLVTCELQRQKCVFYRDAEKWHHLKNSFLAYKEGLICELNDIYILPLINAISSFESLDGAWKVAQEGLINPKVTKLIKNILSGKSAQVNTLEEFLYFTEHAKSFYYSLKNQFTKKFHKEEFLLVEHFLFKQEALIDSFQCRDITSHLNLIISIDQWLENFEENLQFIEATDFKNSNLKLSHLLSMMTSVNYKDNLFFKLLEEKMDKGTTATIQKSFDDEVHSLIHTRLIKTA